MSTKATFKRALRLGHCDVVDGILGEGYIPKPSNINIACRNGDVDLLTRLLRYPMNVQDGLYEALKYKQPHVLNHLFLAGADVNFSDRFGYTTLHYVRDPESCQWLLDMGVKQVCDSFGHMPLYVACSRQIVDVVRILAHNYNGKTNRYSPLSMACHKGNVDIVKILLSYRQGVQSIDQPDDHGNTPLFKACHNGSVEIVKMLLSHEQGLRAVTMVNKYHETPVSRACFKGHTDVVRALLSCSQGVQSLTETDVRSHTALYRTCCTNNIEIVTLLLSTEQGRQTLTQTTVNGNTPLSRACSNGNVEVVKLLLSTLSSKCEKQIDLVKERREQQEYQRDQEEREVIRCLTQPDKKGETPLDKALRKKHMEICKILLDYQRSWKLNSKPESRLETESN